MRKKQPALADWLMDRSAAAEYLGISAATLESMRQNEMIPFYDLAAPQAKKALIRYRKSDIDRFLEARRVA